MRVPIGTRTVVGCVIGHDAAIDVDAEPRDVVDVLDCEPFLPPAVVDLCRWVADYYMAGIGDAIGAAMPPGAGARRHTRPRSVVSYRAGTGRGLATGRPQLTAKQRAVLEMLAASPTASGRRRCASAASQRGDPPPRRPRSGCDSRRAGGARPLPTCRNVAYESATHARTPASSRPALGRSRSAGGRPRVSRGAAPWCDRKRQNRAVHATGAARRANAAGRCS